MGGPRAGPRNPARAVDPLYRLQPAGIDLPLWPAGRFFRVLGEYSPAEMEIADLGLLPLSPLPPLPEGSGTPLIPAGGDRSLVIASGSLYSYRPCWHPVALLRPPPASRASSPTAPGVGRRAWLPTSATGMGQNLGRCVPPLHSQPFLRGNRGTVLLPCKIHLRAKHKYHKRHELFNETSQPAASDQRPVVHRLLPPPGVVHGRHRGPAG